jgi:outer membrane protein TolC
MKTKQILLASCSVLLLGLSGCSVVPVPIAEAERSTATEANVAGITPPEAKVTRPVPLSEAVARAVMHNHDYRSQLLLAAFESKQLDLANWSMAPDVLANAGYRHRDRENLTLSRNTGTGAISTNPSLSEDRSKRIADITFSWNLLDFGLSYMRAQQQADKYLQAAERGRRVRHQIVQETITAWYRAEASQRLQKNIDPMMARVRKALDASRASETSRAETPLVALNYQRELLDMLQTLDVLKKELTGADAVLAAIIGVRPGTPLSTGKADLVMAHQKMPRGELEKIALRQRPDVQAALYQSRITEKDARLAMMSLLPVPNLNFGPSYDSNSYLVHNSWVGASASVAQSLVKPFRYGDTVKLNEARQELDREQGIAITVATLLQVNLAEAQLRVVSEALATADAQLDVAKRIHKQVSDATASQQQPEINLIREDLKLLLTQVRRDLAALEVETARVRLLTSVGQDIVPELNSEADLNLAAQEIRQRGRTPLGKAPAQQAAAPQQIAQLEETE